jgi:two-component system, cell cycle response regulator
MRMDRQKVRNRLWPPPDPLLTAAGARGEVLVAKIRLLLTCVLFLIPVVNAFSASDRQEIRVGFGLTLTAFLLSALAYPLVARGFAHPWIGFATSAFDVTLVSAGLAVFLVLGRPHTAVNSKVVFEAYFLAIGATCLRYDRRVCLIAGLLACGEYLAIVISAAVNWDLNSPVFAPFPYGMFSWNSQLSRLIIMVASCFLSIAVVTRTQELLRRSIRDPLTGLVNRTHFSERIAIEVSRAQRRRQPLTIAMVDVDHFKSFNDRHGHAAGDMALKTIADMLRGSLRKADIIGRYGGEEFVIAMPDTNAATAVQKLERLRQVIADTPMSITKGGHKVSVTISAGLAGFPDDGVEEEELLNAADGRLFRAKANGRNRVVV